MKNLIAGNWKMNGTLESSLKLAKDIVAGIQADPQVLEKNDFLVCPPFPYIVPVEGELTRAVSIGAQDCAAFEDGAYTADVSAKMLKNIHCSHVILGHSERRQYHGLTDARVKTKAEKAHADGLIAIICVGETEEQREQGIQEQIVGQQLRDGLPEGVTAENTVIAYEPVWAIGTGKTATVQDIEAMHGFIRKQLQALCIPRESGDLQDGEEDSRFRGKNNEVDTAQIRILYGGSMKPTNAAEILAIENVNGGLIGGASLKAEDFVGIASKS